ncbi:hypothetical protein [Paraburkholderia tropica]|uniref:hypothetical protein n=1 Tax=Paraburkholderia tropica TaxID=92647 RepID=UPI0008024D6D|nr:hypothetical protein [Paraburkholderia tropica]OBR52363.1 hypothetical protein A6456_10725 [Paraburkholderia tropica]
MIKGCAPGDRATTYASKQEPFFACPTRELASYTSSVLGLISLQIQLTGTPPNISDKTGEPEYLDQNGKPNETRLLLDALRHKAGVATFDQAIAACAPGRNKAKVTVMNVQKDDGVIYVHDAARNLNYWMPWSSLDKR